MNISAFTSLALKISGIIFILSSVLDYLIILIPLNIRDSQWVVGTVGNIVDRGIVPLVGIIFVLVAYWIDNASDARRSAGPDFKLPVFIFASVLGLLFLLSIPFYVVNLNKAQDLALKQIEQRSEQANEQIRQRLNQIKAISQNPQVIDQQIAQLTQALEAGSAQGRPLTEQQLAQLKQQNDQLKQLRDLSKKPQDFKKRTDEIKERLETTLIEQRQRAEGQARTQALKQGLRIGLSSVMLTVVYNVIGWLGIKGSLGSKM